MSQERTELAIIGAGPAGLAAAVTAARAGVAVTLIDEYPEMGGQYLRRSCLDERDGPIHRPRAQVVGERLREELSSRPVKFRPQTLVWDLSQDKTLALFGPRGAETLQAQAVIVAAGATERVVPFPGWTLPGVMTVGAMQTLVKQGVRPGQRVLLAGSGPLLLPVACQLVLAGATVVAVLEAAPWQAWCRCAGGLWGHWDKLREGRAYLRFLRRARVPLRLGWAVVRAFGRKEVEGVEIARLDGAGRLLSKSQEPLEVDAIGLGFGFVPATELTRLAGGEHQHRTEAGGLIPLCTDRLETTVSGLFAAGETTGIGGADLALLEGEMAGLAAAGQLGHGTEEEAQPRLVAAIRRRRHHLRLAARIHQLFRPPPALLENVTDETVVCRCEQVTAGEVRAAVRLGVRDLNALKTCTRAGLGFCQGRVCGSFLADFVARAAGCSADLIRPFSVRPPLKPVPLEVVAGKGETSQA